MRGLPLARVCSLTAEQLGAQRERARLLAAHLVKATREGDTLSLALFEPAR